MNQNIERHNKKFQIGAVIQGAKILEILKYSKNGKSVEFLFECPICHTPFVCNASVKKKKLCLKCQGLEMQSTVDSKTSSAANKDASIIKDDSVRFELAKLPKEITGGIYKIECKNAIYIGETFNFRKRWNVHMKDLQDGAHCNFLLQNYYNKQRTMKFEVIESFSKKNFQTDWEKLKPYIKILNLMKESKIIDEKNNSGYKVLNVERTYEAVAMNFYIAKIVQFLQENKINDYNDLLNLPIQTIPEVNWKQVNQILKDRKC